MSRIFSLVLIFALFSCSENYKIKDISTNYVDFPVSINPSDLSVEKLHVDQHYGVSISFYIRSGRLYKFGTSKEISLNDAVALSKTIFELNPRPYVYIECDADSCTLNMDLKYISLIACAGQKISLGFRERNNQLPVQVVPPPPP